MWVRSTGGEVGGGGWGGGAGRVLLFVCYIASVPASSVYQIIIYSTSAIQKKKKKKEIRYSHTKTGLGGSVGCAVRLETRRSRVQPPPRSATFFRGD